MYKVYICGLCQAGDIESLKESLLPIYPFYDGLQYVIHNPVDETYDFLESIKKDGKIIKTDWTQRLDYSRDHYLFEGTMKTGDYFINLDVKEKLFPKFFEYWPQLKQFLEHHKIDGVLLYGKRFLYRYNEFLKHQGNPHEMITGATQVIELTDIDFYKDSSWYWHDVHKNSNRDKFHFVFHFLKYYTFPHSNHAIMGNENNKDRYIQEETIRRQFRVYLEHNNYLPLTKDKFIWLCQYKMNDIKDWCNNSKILNDAVRYLYYKREDFKDDHNYLDIIKI